MKKYTFATALNCIDGRTQEPLIAFLKKRFGVDYVDMITEPGVDQVLSQYRDKPVIALIKKSVWISLTKHKSKIIVIAGHHDCAGNPVTTSKHLKQIKKSVARLCKWGFGVLVLGVWINKKLQVKEVALVE